MQATRLAAGGYAARKVRKLYKIELVEKQMRWVAVESSVQRFFANKVLVCVAGTPKANVVRLIGYIADKSTT